LEEPDLSGNLAGKMDAVKSESGGAGLEVDLEKGVVKKRPGVDGGFVARVADDVSERVARLVGVCAGTVTRKFDIDLEDAAPLETELPDAKAQFGGQARKGGKEGVGITGTRGQGFEVWWGCHGGGSAGSWRAVPVVGELAVVMRYPAASKAKISPPIM